MTRPLRIISPIHKALRQIQIWMESKCRSAGLIPVEGHLLGYVQAYGPCPISEVHRVLGDKRSTLTSMLDRLERRGLVARKPNPRDRRSWLVGLTPKGRSLAAKLRKVCEEFESKVLAQIAPGELKEFQKVLDAVGRVTNVQVRPTPVSATGSAPASSPRRARGGGGRAPG